MYPRRNVIKPCAFIIACLLTAIGAILTFFAPWFYTITTNLALSLTTKPTFDLWRKNVIPLYLEFYIFNWTNPDEIYKRGVKPHFEEIGPFVFEETKEKVNISWNENNTITFRHLRYWYFNEERSIANLSTKVTTINAVAMFAAYMIKDWSFVMRKGFHLSIAALSTKLEKPTTVGQLLFDGYDDPLINLANSMPQLGSLPIPSLDKFGWFYTRNGSYAFDGTYHMETSGPTFGEAVEWNYNENMTYYEGDCNEVKGSTGEFYGPNLQRDKIGFFSSDICRYVPMDYAHDVDVDGTKGYKYALGDSFLDNGTKVPENLCYCGEYCTPYGALNISSCRFGAPAFVSQPHFYDADPYYLDKITGLKPVKEKHQMFMILEPATGIPLHVEARLQLNILVTPVPSIGIVEDVPTFLFPVIWFEQKARIPWGLHMLLKCMLHMQLIMRCVGGVMLIIGIPWLVYQPFMRKIKSRSPRETSSTIPEISLIGMQDCEKPLMNYKEKEFQSR